MVFSGTNSDSLIEDITFRTAADLNMFPIGDRTRYINEAYSRVCDIIINSDGRMSWDDANYPDTPITYTDLVKDQKKYTIFSDTPTALQDWLYIERIDIEDADGNGIQLVPIDEKDLDGMALKEFNKESSLPTWFDFNGTEVTLYPASDYDRTKGLKMYFKRTPSYFTVSDTTKRPGFATIFHQYLSIYAANQFNFTKKKDNSLQSEIIRLETEIGKFYSKRPSKYETPVLSNKRGKMLR
ncbi:MAG: hypothetical protein WCN88_04820 [Candidatus Falkowbacteria bacterium]